MIDSLDEKKRRLLALLLKEKGIDPARAPIVPLPRGPASSFPLSFAQERLWVIDQLEPGNIAYNLPTALRLRGRLEPGVLARVFAEIVRRHETLRTTFGVASDGRPVQVISPPPPVPLPRIDLSGLSGEVREAELQRLAVEEGSRPFDLARGPVVRVRLVRLGEEEHALLLTVHHIASDGWSDGVLVGEVAALYDAFAHGRPSPLPELPVQYADYAAWQRQAFAGEALERALAWWRERLDGAPVLTLPTDRPRPAVQGPGGSAVFLDLPAGLTERLKGLGRASGATLFMVVTAAFQALLSRLSGQTDLTVGTPAANRHKTEVEGLVGFFVNTLVLRADLSGDPPFAELLARVRRGAVEAFQHGEVPFSRIVEELKPERSLSHSPLFQVMCALANAPASHLEISGLRFEYLEALLDSALFDLSLTVEDTPAGGAVTLEYRTDLFDRTTALRLLGAYAVLLEAVVEDPGRRLSELPLLTPPERQALLAEWNDTAAEDAGESLEEAFAAAAERHAEKTALVFEGRALTFREVESRARGLAQHLRDLGVGPGSRVGLSAERSPEAVIALLAVLKAGAAYVPLDPAYPEERRAFMLEDSGATLLLTRETLGSSVSPSVPLSVSPSVPDLAYLIYTSGSTGRPKGVAMTRRALANLLAWQEREALSGPARTLQFASLSFDVSFQEIASTWLSGGTLVLVSEEVRRDPVALLALLDRERVERLFLPFVALRQLAEAAETAGGGESLRDVVTAGEQLQVTRAVASWLEKTGARLHNHYGPSESHVVTALTLAGDPFSWPALPPIGRPIANTRIRLLDEGLQPVPMGVPGELCIGGVALARGYLDRPDLTAERFIPDPYGDAGERLYRTGDLARWRTDGAIEYLGRRDGQVKIRGVRVEPGEVETALDAHPGVRGAVVVPQPEPASPGALRLVAFYVPAPGAEPSSAELRDFLAARLPAAIVPSVFVSLEAFPTTPSGKVDRRALVFEGSEAASEGYVPPRTATEERLAGLWSALLGAGRVGARDNFFELGGHSLLATQLVSRVREAFLVEIPQRALFEAPTVEELARRIEAAAREEAPPVVPVPRDGRPLPLSFAQERLWFLDQLEPGNPTFNMPALFPLAGDVDPGVLARALSEAARRHEVLRTTFGSEEGRPFQRIAPARPVPLPVVDLRGCEREAGRLEAEEALRPFDLARGPLLRALLLRRGDRDWLLLLTLHHTVADGWSMSLLRRELGTLYAAFSAGRPSPLPEPPVQYADYAVWQRRWLSGRVLEDQIAYWRGQLLGAPGLDLPTDRPRPALQTFRGESLLHAFPAGLSARLAALARSGGATLFMVLLAGLQALLSRLAGQEDVVVGSPVAGRVRTEIEGLVGCFLNNLALRTDLSGNPSFRELLGRARATALDAYAHQDVPFERLLEEIRPERDLSRTPVFQVFLNMLNLPAEDGGEEGAEIAEVHSKFDLTVYAAQGAGEIRLSLVYNAGLFDRERIAGLAAQLETLLAQAAADPEARIGSLSLVTGAARAVLPDPAEPLDPSWKGGIPDALARQDPERVAVIEGDTVLTYGELRAEADRIAGSLAAQGVGPEDAVAVWAHRSAALPGTVLGILRAGAAFLVLDPAYPAARLVASLRLARPRAFLTVAGAPPPPPEVEAEVASLARRSGPPGSPAEAGPDDLAVVTFTSGSTGLPRGIAGRHGPLTRFLPWMADRFGLSGEDRFGLLSALPHDPLQRDLFTPVWLGAALVVPDPERIGSPGYLAEWVRRHGVTVLNLTPAMLELLVRAAEETGAALPSLRRVFVVGDLLKRSDVLRLYRVAPGVTCVNLYGSTETQRALSYFVVPRSGEGPEALPLGRGMEGAQLLVLTPEGALAGIGELGEIHVRSPHLARGYLDDPALTAERFVPDLRGERLYRTGDLGRYRPDGEVEFAGRTDAQVKIRGFRIEPGEIEAALARFPGIRQSVVIVRDGRLVAYAVPRPGADPAPGEIRAFLAGRLPAYMVPADVVVLPSLPLTRTGKIDRRALPAPERAAGKDTVAPRTSTEETLAGFWRELLEREEIGIHDDFFDLGGHSLLVTQLASRLRAAFGVELPLRALFERPTIAGLAALIGESQEGPAAPPLVPRPGTDGLPLSFSQQRLWFLHQLDPKSPAYNMYQALRLAGELDEAALEAALSGLVRRQASLRTRFETRGARPVQAIGPVPGLLLPVIDLTALPEAAKSGEGERITREESLRPFDLERGPVFRVRLLRLAPGERGLVVALHHIVSDGWSMGLFVHELSALYRAFAAGEPSPLPPLPIRYADFAAWQREWLTGPVLERETAWWRERLAGAPAVLDLPLDRPRPPVLTFRGGRLARRMPAPSAEALLRLGREREATPFMTLLALFAALLLRHTGQEDLVVGSPVANRNRRETEGVIGFFVNTLVFRTDLSGAPGFRTLLARVRETALSAYTHQDLPFEKLVEEIAPERSLRHTPLFQAMFVTRSAPPEGSSPAEGLSLSVLNVENSTAKFDLTMIAEEAPGSLSILFGYNADLFFPTTIHRLLAHCEALLAGVVAEPDRPVSGISLLSEAEQHQLLAEWSAAPAAPAEDAALHELFFARAAERPDALALLSDKGAVTYGELADRALRLAGWLAGQGVGPEVPVGLLADRSPATIAGLLGILAAGGVYVPLDPSWPRERLAFVPEDAGVRLVLTREDSDALGERFPGIRVEPDHAAYVIYTSGSTGTPNGVVVPHRGAVNLLRQAREHYGAGPESRVLQVASPGFDASILEIFLALGSGGALVQVRDEERLTPAVLAERLNTFGVTTLVVTPAFLSVLPEPALKAVRSVSVGGEACPAPLAARWSPGRRFLNCYGPTEASIYATVEIHAGREEGEPPIGRPVAGVQAFVLDADHRPVPLGVAGELCLGGAGLARGYLGQPGRTAAKFIPNPFSDKGDRLYRTGDLARHRPDGRLEFLGRIDRQVKVRGVRIELGEIEAALAAHPQVEAAAVVAHGEGTDRFLAAYAVLREPAPSPAELRRFLAGSLPDAMIPAAVVPLPALPLTPSGKVDRRALPVPGRAEAGGAVAPRNERERFLAELWKEALGLPEIGVHDDFFELGGTSIKAAILTNLLQERLGEPVYVVALFDAPTIARLAVYLETHYRGKAVEATRSSRVSEETVERFRALIPPLPPVPPAAPRNPRAVFLLSPPRSGSTLLRVMLAGNPALFAPPELELLGFNTLKERKAAFSGRYAFWAEGTVRALMEVEGCGAEEAWQIMADAEERDLSVRGFYREIQERTAGRLLVDKTPSYSLDRATLERAEADFEKPLYLHLLRHPYGMISSFEKARLEQVFFRVPHPFSRRELAELIWLTSQRNILAFLDGIEPERQLRLRFEDLVQDPRAAMERVCAFLGVPFTPAMLDPYEDTGRRMTDGIHALSRMVGDVKFHEHKAIDPQVAESWKKEIAEDFLGEPTWKMAESLGYRKKTAPSLIRLQPKGDRPPLAAVHPVGGNVLAYAGLARELMSGGRPLWALQSAGLAGNEPHRRIETMAAAYVEELLAARPAGPYPLLGWSLGGSIAFEMARQLTRRGHEVPLLVLVDSLAPGTLSDEALDALDDAELLAGIAGDLAGIAGRDALVTPEELRALPDGERIPFLLRAAEKAGALPTGLGAEPARVLLSVYQANLEAARHYRPAPWPGRALLLRAPRPGESPDSGWGPLVTGGVEVVEIEGDHYSLLRSPRVVRLAREIAARLG